MPRRSSDRERPPSEKVVLRDSYRIHSRTTGPWFGGRYDPFQPTASGEPSLALDAPLPTSSPRFNACKTPRLPTHSSSKCLCKCLVCSSHITRNVCRIISACLSLKSIVLALRPFTFEMRGLYRFKWKLNDGRIYFELQQSLLSCYWSYKRIKSRSGFFKRTCRCFRKLKYLLYINAS